MGKMKELYTALQENRSLSSRDQLFPGDEEELARVLDTIRPSLQRRNTGNLPGMQPAPGLGQLPESRG